MRGTTSSSTSTSLPTPRINHSTNCHCLLISHWICYIYSIDYLSLNTKHPFTID